MKLRSKLTTILEEDLLKVNFNVMAMAMVMIIVLRLLLIKIALLRSGKIVDAHKELLNKKLSRKNSSKDIILLANKAQIKKTFSTSLKSN